MERSAQNIKRLLELFPVTSLRSQWPNVTGTKEEICFEIAEKYKWQGAIEFVNEHLSCCKQHVYIFSHSGQIDDLPAIDLPDTELVVTSRAENGERRQLYIINFEYKVVLRDPFEDMGLTFLWPLRLDFTEQHLIARFVILEKNISSYLEGRPYYLDRKSTEEEEILKQIKQQAKGQLNLEVVDLHKGVKKLWESGIIDSPRARFKKAFSTAFEAMDEDRTIKEHAPELYEILRDSLLFNTTFQVVGKEDCSVSAFSVDPVKGFITFHRYADNAGDSDYVVREILKYN
jgi:hypothetical protein